MSPPGDYTSDAQFFVFTGVVSFLATMILLVVYVFFSPAYESADKKAPMIVSWPQYFLLASTVKFRCDAQFCILNSLQPQGLRVHGSDRSLLAVS